MASGAAEKPENTYDLTFALTTNSSTTLSIPSGSRGYIFTNGNSSAVRGGIIAYAAQGTSISTTNVVGPPSAVSITTSGNTMTITNTSASYNLYIMLINAGRYYVPSINPTSP